MFGILVSIHKSVCAMETSHFRDLITEPGANLAAGSRVVDMNGKT
jgi:hypothetical protein